MKQWVRGFYTLARFEDLTAVLLSIQVFWCVTLCFFLLFYLFIVE